MSHQQQNNFLFNQSSAGTAIDFDLTNYNPQYEESEAIKSPKSRRDQTNYIFEKLFKTTVVRRPGERDVTRTGRRLNKNEILGVTLARLIKEKHLNGINYSRDIELTRGIQLKTNTNDFVLVLRMDGRIVSISDEAEHHLGKSMRSLYAQCINIFQCLNKTDGNKLRAVFNSSFGSAEQEHRLVCTFRLPKGKRPSRIQEDVKTISMVGHVYSCHDVSSSSHERLFIARCEALLSRSTTGSNSSQTSLAVNNNDNANSLIKITLNEDMSISTVSPNVKDILGYHRNDLIGHWFGRYLSTDDLEKFEIIRKKYFEQDGQQQQNATSICEIFDIFTNYGDARLTFLFQMRPVRERRSKAIKFALVGQLIDPSLRNEYIKYVAFQPETSPKSTKADEVNHRLQLSSSVPKTSQEPVVALSPSLEKGLFKFDDISNTGFVSDQQQQHSPIHRSLSNVVTPVDFDDEFWRELLSTDFSQYTTTTDLSDWPTKTFDDIFGYHSEQQLEEIFDEYLHNY